MLTAGLFYLKETETFLVDKNEELIVKMYEINDDKVRLKSRINNLDVLVAELADESFVLTENNNRLVEDNADLRNMNKELKKGLQELEEEIEKLRKKLNDTEKKLESKIIEDAKKSSVKKVSPKKETQVASIKPTRNASKNNTNEVMLLARLIYAEAEGEPTNGLIAVGNVVMNRVESNSFPDTMKGVIYQHKQFSVVANGRINRTPKERYVEASKRVLNGERVVPKDTLFFYAYKHVGANHPIRKRATVVDIGGHRFAK